MWIGEDPGCRIVLEGRAIPNEAYEMIFHGGFVNTQIIHILQPVSELISGRRGSTDGNVLADIR